MEIPGFPVVGIRNLLQKQGKVGFQSSPMEALPALTTMSKLTKIEENEVAMRHYLLNFLMLITGHEAHEHPDRQSVVKCLAAANGASTAEVYEYLNKLLRPIPIATPTKPFLPDDIVKANMPLLPAEIEEAFYGRIFPELIAGKFKNRT